MGILNVTPDSFLMVAATWILKARLPQLHKWSKRVSIFSISAAKARALHAPARFPPMKSLPASSRSARGSCSFSKRPDLRGHLTKRRLQKWRSEEGADIINDIYALRAAPEIAELVAAADAGLILMHMQGTPETMQQNPLYGEVAVDIKNFLRDRIAFAIESGCPRRGDRCGPRLPDLRKDRGAQRVCDVSIARLEYFSLLLQRPICVGVSAQKFPRRAPQAACPALEREEATHLPRNVWRSSNGAAIVAMPRRPSGPDARLPLCYPVLASRLTRPPRHRR